jgi:alpha-mannosidase
VRPLRAIRTLRCDGTLPLSGSLVEIEPPEVILSALKLAEDGDGVVGRVYNIADREVSGSMKLHGLDGTVERVNLNEEEPVPVDTEDGRVTLALRPNEIATFKFRQA